MAASTSLNRTTFLINDSFQMRVVASSQSFVSDLSPTVQTESSVSLTSYNMEIFVFIIKNVCKLVLRYESDKFSLDNEFHSLIGLNKFTSLGFHYAMIPVSGHAEYCFSHNHFILRVLNFTKCILIFLEQSQTIKMLASGFRQSTNDSSTEYQEGLIIQFNDTIMWQAKRITHIWLKTT